MPKLNLYNPSEEDSSTPLKISMKNNYSLFKTNSEDLAENSNDTNKDLKKKPQPKKN